MEEKQEHLGSFHESKPFLTGLSELWYHPTALIPCRFHGARIFLTVDDDWATFRGTRNTHIFMYLYIYKYMIIYNYTFYIYIYTQCTDEVEHGYHPTLHGDNTSGPSLLPLG